MKRLIIAILGTALLTVPLAASEAAHSSAPAAGAHGAAAADTPFTEGEKALVFDRRYLLTDEHGSGILVVHGEPLTPARIQALSPWDLMELVQTLSGTELPLSRFGNGNGDGLTQAWRQRVADFASGVVHHGAAHEEDPFDPALVLWDPGYIQTKDEWGQWTIRIGNRSIVQADLATLSPLEVQQAVAVLTARTYPVEYVLDHLEEFRAQLSIVPREPAPAADAGGHH